MGASLSLINTKKELKVNRNSVQKSLLIPKKNIVKKIKQLKDRLIIVNIKIDDITSKDKVTESDKEKIKNLIELKKKITNKINELQQ